MSDGQIINDDVVDDMVKNIESELQQKPEIVKNKNETVVNNHEEQTTKIDGIGEIDLVNQDELESSLNNFNGVLFKVQNCVFRVCYTDARKGRFTAEIVNLRKKKST